METYVTPKSSKLFRIELEKQKEADDKSQGKSDDIFDEYKWL